MAKKSFKQLNQVEKNLMVAGLTAEVIRKKCVRIGRNNALKILNLSTMSKQKESINKIRSKC